MLIPTCVIKLLELTLAVACLTLHHYSYDLSDVPALILYSGTYMGYVIVLSGEIVGEMIFAPLDLVQDMYFGMLGIILFSVSGGIVLSTRAYSYNYPLTGDSTTALIVGYLAILNAVVMLFDLSLAYLDSEQFDDEASEAVSAAADAYIDAWWSAAGSVLFGACGALTLNNWKYVPDCARHRQARTTAVCAFAAAALFLLDALIALCSAHKDADSIRSKSSKRCSP
ncbi:unnamed protein product, partial [Brenthis ino]